MVRYILLAVTWCVLLASIIYLLVTDGSQPHIILWIVLAVLSLIPLAERLKISNWFEFNKKVDNINKGISSTQKEIARINNQLNAYFTNVQRQQQFNIALSSEEAARGFAESMYTKSKMEYPTMGIAGLMSKTEDTILPVIDDIISDSMQRHFFISAADAAIASIFPLLQILYSTVIAKQNDKLASYEEISKDILSIIEEINKHAPDVYKFEDSDKKFKELLDPVKKLVLLRRDVHENKKTPPSIEDGRELLKDVSMATGYFMGMISTGISMLVRGYILNSINTIRRIDST